ncbi:MAG: UbiX family flavin prenyltransferase [Archaeoglobus sp.]|uniref:UbiX family flavin prenyltransferase n=1 Tax=Archaeoglobus sp. TaxID=1872626 RepID=UPI001E104CBE|nr:UbiX family flavin prenyltransferase [Archaeoglobus sp.]MBO8180427.1 UbiX family flavin prenyltransferase [Archaeoglobus sp.]
MRFVVALTGASGQILGIRLIEKLIELGAEVYAVASAAAKITLKIESDYDEGYVREIATKYYDEDEIAAPFASGSFRHDGMAIVPCSIKTASSIAYGIADNLITRAADVTLKEKRKLVLAVREAPLHTGHLRTLTTLSEIGAVIYPPVLSFYTKPKNLDDMVDHTVSRIIELLGVEVDYKRWG